MISVLSPAKTLDYETALPYAQNTLPSFLDQSGELINVLRDYDVDDVQKLMKVSEKIAVLNVDRYQTFETPFTTENARPAIFAFKGDVYRDLSFSEYQDENFEFLQKHVRILSGLYGILRPLDLMQPYRLEMGTRLENPKGKNLYQFWGAQISQTLNDLMEDQGDDILLNLASEEYFKSVDRVTLKGQIVDVTFLDFKKGKYKIVSFYAKRARGMMTDYIVRNQLDDVESLKSFDTAGYYYSEEQSTETKLVFLRDEI